LVSSDILLEENIQFDSWIRFDSIHFHNTSGTTPAALPNNDMENWMNYEYLSPDSWYTTVDLVSNESYDAIQQTEDAYEGDYAVEIQTINIWGTYSVPGYLSLGELSFDEEEPVQAIPYSHQPNALTGYYKYLPSGDEDGFVNIQMESNDEVVGGNFFMFETQSDWTFFEIPLNYLSVPEEMILVFSSGYNAGSVLFLDNLSFDFTSATPLIESNDVSMFPNPANDIISFSSQYNNEIVEFQIVNLQSEVITSFVLYPNEITRLDISELSSGIYFIKSVSGNILTQKLVKL
jgi:hypothetical protein